MYEHGTILSLSDIYRALLRWPSRPDCFTEYCRCQCCLLLQPSHTLFCCVSNLVLTTTICISFLLFTWAQYLPLGKLPQGTHLGAHYSYVCKAYTYQSASLGVKFQGNFSSTPCSINRIPLNFSEEVPSTSSEVLRPLITSAQ